MLYHKVKINDQKEMDVELYEDEIFTYCGDCGTEMEVEPPMLAGIINDGGDFSGTTFYCVTCSEKRKKRDGLFLIKGDKNE